MATIITSAKASATAKAFLTQRYMNPSYCWGYHTGFERLDVITGGIQWETVKEYTIVASRPNVGKSAFGLTEALTMAYQFKSKFTDREVRICLLEMDAVTCQIRLASQLSGVPISLAMSGFETAEQKSLLDQKLDLLASLPIVYAEGSYSVDYIYRFVRDENPETGKICGLLVVDHIGVVSTDKASKSNPAFNLAGVSHEFQGICHSFTPGIILAQLNREAGKVKEGKPTVDMVFGSDGPLQDADRLLLLDRPDLRTDFSPEELAERAGKPELARIIIGKNRLGGFVNEEVPVLYHRERAIWLDVPPEIREKMKAA